MFKSRKQRITIYFFTIIMSLFAVVGKVFAEGTLTPPCKNYGYNITRGLSKYENALKNVSMKKVKIYCIGDSVTRGEYSSDEVNKSWVGVMKASLQNQYGNAGEGFISVYEGALPMGTKPRWRLGDGWSVSGALNTVTSNVGGFGGCFAISNESTSPAAITFTGTDIDLLYAKAPECGTATITIDGIKVGTIDCLDETSSFSHKVSYSSLNNTRHTLVITPDSSANVLIEGAIASSSTLGIEIDKIAISSKRASYFNDPLQKESWDALPAPDLVLLSFGLNEAGNHVSVEEYKSNMIGLVTYWQERGCNVCIVVNQEPASTWTKNWFAYVNAMYDISNTYNTAIIDICKAYANYNVPQKLGVRGRDDNYTAAQKEGLFGMVPNDYSGGGGTNIAHPSDKGYKYIGDIIYNSLQ